MPRLTCCSLLLVSVLLAAAAVVYTYFIQHQPNASLLATIKAKDLDAFKHELQLALSHVPHSSSVDSVHFGNGRSLAHAVAMHGTLDMLSHLHSLSASLSSPSSADLRVPLHIAAMYNTAPFLSLLLSLLPASLPAPLRVDPVASNGFTPLLYAVLFSQHENAAVLLAHGADAARAVSSSGMKAVQLSIIYSDVRMTEMIIAAGGALQAGDSYYDDYKRVKEKMTKRKEKEAEEAEEQQRQTHQQQQEEEEVDDELLQPELRGLSPDQRDKAIYWAERQRLMEGGEPFSDYERRHGSLDSRYK
jgi:ankyrin repeat protein